MQFNLRRFLLFFPITVALAVLSVYGPNVLPRYAVGPLVVFLFLGLFVIFYSAPRWKLSLPTERMTIPRLLLIFGIVGVVVIGLTWLNLKFPGLAFLIDSTVILVSVLVGLFLLRRRAPKSQS